MQTFNFEKLDSNDPRIWDLNLCGRVCWINLMKYHPTFTNWIVSQALACKKNPVFPASQKPPRWLGRLIFSLGAAFQAGASKKVLGVTLKTWAELSTVELRLVYFVLSIDPYVGPSVGPSVYSVLSIGPSVGPSIGPSVFFVLSIWSMCLSIYCSVCLLYFIHRSIYWSQGCPSEPKSDRCGFKKYYFRVVLA